MYLGVQPKLGFPVTQTKKIPRLEIHRILSKTLGPPKTEQGFTEDPSILGHGNAGYDWQWNIEISKWILSIPSGGIYFKVSY